MNVWTVVNTDKEIFSYNMNNVRKMTFSKYSSLVYVTFTNGDQEVVTGLDELMFKRIVGVV